MIAAVATGYASRARKAEAAPLVVRESGLVVETLDRVRQGLPFALRALDVDDGSEFVISREKTPFSALRCVAPGPSPPS